MHQPSPPVLFVLFRRPKQTRIVFEAIRQARPERLFIAADGPRGDRPEELRLIGETRATTETIDWPCVVERDYSSTNLGAGARVNSAISWALSFVERVIILEDDCLPDSTFFLFCAELLERYADEPRVAAICGSNLHPPDCRFADSYSFSRYPHSWGWATWRRAWADQDITMARWPGLRESRWLDTVIDDPRERAYWKDHFDAAWHKTVDAWDYQWMLACWLHQRLVVHPGVNLVSNIGFGEGATHTVGPHQSENLPRASMPFPLRHPAGPERDVAADRNGFRHAYLPSPMWARILRRLRRLFG